MLLRLDLNALKFKQDITLKLLFCPGIKLTSNKKIQDNF